jgi:hypothetical protein
MVALGRGDPQGTGIEGRTQIDLGAAAIVPLPMVRRNKRQHWDGGC